MMLLYVAPSHPISSLGWESWLIGIGIALLAALCAFESSRDQHRDVQALHAMGQDILRAGFDLMGMCQVIRRYCGLASAAPVFAFQMRDDDQIVMASLLVNGEAAPVEARDAGLGPWRWMERSLQPFLCSDTEAQPLPFEPLAVGAPPRSALYMPVLADDELVGMLSFQSPQAGAFSSRDLDALSLMSSQLALGLQAAQLYRREQQRSAQLLLIAEVSRKVAAILGLETLFADTVRLVQQTLGYYHVCIFGVSTERHEITLESSSSPVIQQQGLAVPWGKGLVGHAAATGRSILANDVRADPRFLYTAALEHTRSELAIPLQVESRILGVLDLQSNHLNAFSPRDLPALQILADQIAVAIEDSRIYEGQQEQAWIATALLQVAEAVSQTSATEEIVETVVRLSRILTGIDCCMVMLWDEESSTFLPVQNAGFGPSEAAAIDRQRIPKGAVPALDRAVALAEMTLCSPQELLPSCPSAVLSNDAPALVFPLRSKGQVTGVLIALPQNGDQIAPPQKTILSGVANYAAIALDNARLLASQREEAWVSTALLQVANVVGRATYNLHETLATVTRLTPMLLGVTWCVVMLWDEEQQRLVVAESYGHPEGSAPDLARGAAQSLADAPWLDALRQTGEPASFCIRDGQPCMGCALWARERLLGVLAVGLPADTQAIAGRRLTILTGIAGQAAMAIETSQLYEQTVRQERLQHEMQLAQRIQKSFLPEHPPEIEGWQVAVDWRAVHGVGGDFYDFIPLDDTHLGLLIADVSDKGVAAALYMALSRTVMRAAALGVMSAAETLQRANRILLQDSRSGMFVSIFYGILDLQTGAFGYARAGHNPPLLIKGSGGSIRALEPYGIVLGVMENPELAEEWVTIDPGDALVMYTDGITEAIDAQEEEFGIQRLVDVLAHCQECQAHVVVAEINRSVQQFTQDQPQFDDFTLVVLARTPTPSGS